jgi:D-tyrosyl-tRNA(Tyr) deacylase
MKLVVQRVRRAEVRVEGSGVAAIGAGLLVLLAVEKDDAAALAAAAAEKVATLRIFPRPGETKMNLSVEDVGGEVLVVSQFTLAGSVRRGRRPSFDAAAPPETATALCDAFTAALKRRGLKVGTGVFGAMMEVELVNDGPVTFWLQSDASGEFGP